MTLEIPASIASRQDFMAMTRDIHAYAAWASHEMIKQKVAGKPTAQQPVISPEAMTILRSWSGGKDMTKSMINDLLKALDDYAKSAPTITITLAAIPTGEARTRLVAWCRKELQPYMLVSFRMNRAILGGMVVAYGSHIHDWSFRRAILESDVSFSEVLERV